MGIYSGFHIRIEKWQKAGKLLNNVKSADDSLIVTLSFDLADE
jgi:hypothetical protein